jgi:pSer/pThr/pTyr-binding forkhead associated (FHA) protein
LAGPVDKPDGNDESTMIADVGVKALVRANRSRSVLEQVGGPGAPRSFPLELAELVIGRALEVHVSIESRLLSRRHAAITRAGAEYRVTDLDSANGIYLNGVKVHSAILHGGDTLQIGDVVMVFREGS